MEFTVSVAGGGRFHIFELAHELQERGVLQKLYTSYPRWRVPEVDSNYLKTAAWLSLPLIGLGRIGLHRLQERFYPITNRAFDRWLSYILEQSDIFHCMSGYGFRSHQTAKKKYGSITICDRASAHIEIQRDLLVEEYNRWGIPHGWSDRAIELDLQEYEECDLITTPSNFVKRTFLEKGFSADRLAVVPFGVDVTLFRPLPKTDTVFRVIYVGTLNLQKGIPYLLDAFAGMKLSNFEVWLIGTETEEIQGVLSMYSGPFKYLGFIPRSQLSQYYSQGSVFILPSIQDGYGMVQSQAMACGLPVIATTNTGAENLFTNGVEGFIIPIRDAQAIREKVLFLYENSQVRDEMASRALECAQNLGAWCKYGDEMMKVYESLLARGSDSR